MIPMINSFIQYYVLQLALELPAPAQLCQPPLVLPLKLDQIPALKLDLLKPDLLKLDLLKPDLLKPDPILALKLSLKLDLRPDLKALPPCPLPLVPPPLLEVQLPSTLC